MIYSSVGFGGGSSYIALLLLLGWTLIEVRSLALICNIAVVSGSVFNYHRLGYISYRKIVPILLFSMPAALLGGYITLPRSLFQLMAATILLLAAFLLYRSNKNAILTINKPSEKIVYAASSFIGLISGIIGIGGGIFLSPLLHLIRWDKSLKIAATASIFILINSLAALIGIVINHSFSLDWKYIFLPLAVIIGGQIGNQISIDKLTPERIRLITAILIALVGIRLLYQFINEL